jgi:predicted nucleic acid-binding protein
VLAELYFEAYRSANPQKHLTKKSIIIQNSILLAINEVTSEIFVKIKLALFAKGKPIPENDI